MQRTVYATARAVVKSMQVALFARPNHVHPTGRPRPQLAMAQENAVAPRLSCAARTNVMVTGADNRAARIMIVFPQTLVSTGRADRSRKVQTVLLRINARAVFALKGFVATTRARECNAKLAICREAGAPARLFRKARSIPLASA